MLACVNCGSTNLTVGFHRKRNVPVHYCGGCGFYCAFGMPKDMAAAMIATREPANLVAETFA